MKLLHFFNKWIFPLIVLYLIYIITNNLLIILLIIFALLGYKIYKSRDVLYSIKAKRSIGENDFEKAILYYKRAICANSFKASHYLELGYLFMLKGDFLQAKEILDNITSSRFSNIDCMNAKSYQSIVQWKLGNLDKAVELAEMAHSDNYQTSNTFGNLTYLYIISNKLDLALKLAKQAYDYNDSNQVIVENYARINHLLGNLDYSLQLYNQLKNMSPKYPEAWYNYALLLIDLERYNDALDAIKKCLDLNFTHLTAITKEDAKHLFENIQNKLSIN